MSAVGITTSEWLSFFLMTVGWFILLTSLLGFWRVKRWERGILSPQRSVIPRIPEEAARDQATLANIVGFPVLSRGDLRGGFGFGIRTRDSERAYVVHETDAAGRMDNSEREPMMPTEESEEESEMRANDRRLRDALRASGLL